MSEYKNKTVSHELGNTVSDYIKYEATYQTRVAVAAAPGTKAGTFVDFPLRGKKLIALTDESDGKVLVQPHNCVIDLSLLTAAAVNAATAESGLDGLKKEGDPYGIVYTGTPKD
ncbi:oxaloacetate decarboxylase alpha chain [Neisseria weixii]|uniref:oxaloacetate decarboxylase alpha chain n=1 Tax=Neisseria weixii TaxID=1853276 RepID=UPI003621253E